MAKAPAERFDSAAEFATALEAAGRGKIEPSLAARADRVLAKHPWDSALGPLSVNVRVSEPSADNE